ncbi:ChaN family lipoprotein [candidate division KSB1 bacterium]
MPVIKDVEIKSDHYRIIRTSDQATVTIDEMISDIKENNIVFIGESHNDPVAHYFELEVTKRLFSYRPELAVAFEMFDRDVQTIINEYLNGHIQEEFLIKDARAWKNYETDYKPVLEFAKKNNLPVIASNAPRRYVRIVSTKGFEALDKVENLDKTSLAPLPLRYPENPEYRKKFFDLMRPPVSAGKDAPKGMVMPMMNLENTFNAQVLWDATMAYSIGQFFKKQSNYMIIHINGSFHSDNKFGILAHLNMDFSSIKMATLTVVPVDDLSDEMVSEYTERADYIILSDKNLPRSYK